MHARLRHPGLPLFKMLWRRCFFGRNLHIPHTIYELILECTFTGKSVKNSLIYTFLPPPPHSVQKMYLITLNSARSILTFLSNMILYILEHDQSMLSTRSGWITLFLKLTHFLLSDSCVTGLVMDCSNRNVACPLLARSVLITNS